MAEHSGTISSGFGRLFAIHGPPFPKHSSGPVQWGRLSLVAEPPVATEPADALVPDLRHRLASDPLRRWTLDEISDGAGLSARTLQRRLTDQGLSLSRLVAEARLQVAAGYLIEKSGPSLAEIGFLAGYSDQAHFTRAFAKGVGTSPRRYREDFGSASS